MSGGTIFSLRKRALLKSQFLEHVVVQVSSLRRNDITDVGERLLARSYVAEYKKYVHLMNIMNV